MKNKKKLELGTVVIINSPLRLKGVHGKKGYISAYSYNKNEFTAYSVTVGEECWFVLFEEIKTTNEKIDPNIGMTNDRIKVFVDNKGQGDAS